MTVARERVLAVFYLFAFWDIWKRSRPHRFYRFKNRDTLD
jgi:hypothetical protein